MSAQHTPGMQCVECEGFCLFGATIDKANTALATARTALDRLHACEALALAATLQAQHLRSHMGIATGSAA